MKKALLRFVIAAVFSLVPVFARQLSAQSGDYVTAGTETRRGFLVDNVLHSSQFGGIHFSSYVPKEYDGSKPYALFITLPGWGGLYSCGGETGSIVIGKRPDLYAAFLHVSSKWTG